MIVWIITVGEPLPIDNDNVRLYRSGLLAEILQNNGHNVTWWTSSVDHIFKKQRCSTDNTVEISGNYRIKLLHGVLYKRNISILRIINHFVIAKKFFRLAVKEPIPDIILCSLPTLFLSYQAVKFGKRKRVPVVIDIRDLWPDVFADIGPVWMNSITKCLLYPLYCLVNWICNNATAIIGITSAFVNWGLLRGQRKPSPFHKEFPLAYIEQAPDPESQKQGVEFWSNNGVTNSNGEFIVCFFGTFGRQFDLETVIHAAKILSNNKIRFILCGNGDYLDYYKKLAVDSPNILFPGWVQANHIWTLMRMSSVGLAPYVNTENFICNLPNKPIEYLSAGLPIITSLSGTLSDLITEHECGLTYRSDKPEQLAELLLNLYNNPDQHQIMSANALNLYKKKFVAETVYCSMVEHLRYISDCHDRSF